MAAHPVMTEDREDTIIKALGEGGTRRNACRLAKVSEDTFARHMTKNETFAERVHEAEAGFEKVCVNVIIRAMPTSWTAAAWFLERKFPKTWGRRTQIDIRTLSDSELAEVAAEIDD